MKKLTEVQSKLKAKKSKYSSFGKYHYRSCEDILEAVKPLLLEHDLVMTVTDDVILVGDRFYLKATVRVSDDTQITEVSAMARESQSKKGMDDAQLTGSCSSYARKSALSGMFLIDDGNDVDGQDNRQPEVVMATEKQLVSLNTQYELHKERLNDQQKKYIESALTNGIDKDSYNKTMDNLKGLDNG